MAQGTKVRQMRKSVLALAIASLMFAGIILQATASAEPAITTKIVPSSHASSFATEANNSTIPPGSEGGIVVVIGGIIVFVGVLGFFLLMTLRKRKKKGIE
jgi:ABC-type multidrug transport system permease subunit